MRKIGFISFVLLLFAGLASAQVPTSGNVFFGYSYENTSSSALGFANSSRANLNGWEASVEGKVFPWVGFVGDVAGHYGSQSYVFNVGGQNSSVNVNAHEFTAMFGPRVSVSVGKLRPFAQAMFGVGHITTSQSAAVAENFGLPRAQRYVVRLGPGWRPRLQSHSPHRLALPG